LWKTVKSPEPSSPQALTVALVLAALMLSAAERRAEAAGRVRLDIEPASAELARGGDTGLTVRAAIASGWHINAHKPNEPFLIPTELSLTLPPGIAHGTIRYPEPESKSFAFAPGKQLLVHEGTLVLTTSLTVPADFAGSQVRAEFSLRYQACNDTTCAPPATATAELVVPVRGSLVPGADVDPGAAGGAQIDVARWLAERGLPVTLLIVALLGLGLNLTPCVYPLISVTLAYFGTQSHHHPWRVAALAAVYVLGIVLSFSLVGLAASYSGGVFGALLQKPGVLLALAALMVLLALSCFGVYQMQPPAWLMRRASSAAPGAVGALFMGLTMGIVAAPCIGPVVVGLLVYVGSQQDPLLGFELFFALGLGMGLPYLALALAAGSIRKLPRSGDWLTWVERLFGFVLIGLAAYFVAPLLPRSVARLLVPAVMACAGIYLGFIDSSGGNFRLFRPLQRTAGLVALLTALWTVMPPRAESTIRWTPYSAEALQEARAAGRPSVLDLVADWCIPCHEMDATTFLDSEVQREAQRFAMLRADITTENEATTALTEQLDVKGVPTIIVFDAAGNEADRMVGYVGADRLLTALRRVR
jgi:thiol:disulfide interchange protein DsbD